MQNTEQNKAAHIASTNVPMGRIVSVTGSQAIVQLDHSASFSRDSGFERPEMGTLLKIDTPQSTALGMVSALSVPVPVQRDGEPEIWIAELELVGELIKEKNGETSPFRRGISVYPSLGDLVYPAPREELARAYMSASEGNTAIGKVHQDPTIDATICIDELLGKHFAVLGTTGTGKSCTVALILQTILKENPQAHMVLLDPHSEYASAFEGKAEIITPADLHLPFWLLTFEEIVEVLLGERKETEKQVEILAELIPHAKALYSTGRARTSQVALKRSFKENTTFTVDSPLPYRLSDILSLIEERMGLLEHKNGLAPYKQLKSRIEAISQDPRYAFMFGNLTVQDYMVDVLGRMFRIPVNNKPLSIIELSGIPSEIVNVVVSVLCRMSFDFALWSEGMVPITLVCEEAHRYIPTDASLGFEPTRRSIARIAKEGRKYGVSLCIVSQRPSELDQTILSQCNTVFAMRMSNERDQQIVSAAVSDSASGLLDFLPSLGMREAIAFGDGVSLPGRIKLNKLDKDAMPRGQTALFSERWNKNIGNAEFLQAIVQRWRMADNQCLAPEEDMPVQEQVANYQTQAYSAHPQEAAPVAAHAPHAPHAPMGQAAPPASPAPHPNQSSFAKPQGFQSR